MSVSKTWKIEGIDVRPSVGSLSNVVCQVQWSLTMERQDESGNVIATGFKSQEQITLTVQDFLSLCDKFKKNIQKKTFSICT